MNVDISKIELDCKIAEAMLDSYFSQLFALKQERSGHYIDFSNLASQLDSTFHSLIGHVELKWERAINNGSYKNEELESIAKVLGHCRTFFESQKQQLFCRIDDETDEELHQ